MPCATPAHQLVTLVPQVTHVHVACAQHPSPLLTSFSWWCYPLGNRNLLLSSWLVQQWVLISCRGPVLSPEPEYDTNTPPVQTPLGPSTLTVNGRPGAALFPTAWAVWERSLQRTWQQGGGRDRPLHHSCLFLVRPSSWPAFGCVDIAVSVGQIPFLT